MTKGVEVYHRREHRDGLFLIEEGRVRVYRVSLQGDQLTLALLSAGPLLHVAITAATKGRYYEPAHASAKHEGDR